MGNPNSVTVNGIELSYVIEGTGIPCIVIGDAREYQHLFSHELRKYFKLIFLATAIYGSCDVDLKKYTMNSILNEVEQTRIALDIDKISVLGHSYTSLVALEYAKKYPDHTSHLIMIAYTPGLSATFIKEREEYWVFHTSEERKRILEQNQERLPDDEHNKLDPSNAFIARAVRDAPLYWFDPAYDATWIFEGVQFNSDLLNHISSVILPKINFMSDLERLTMPVFLAVGRYDFACPYYLWNDYKDRISDLSYHLFERSGHFPMFEEQALFDKKLIDWITRSNR